MSEKSKNFSENYISLTEASKLCKYSEDYLRLRARQGKLKAVKIGRNWMTTKLWLEEYIEKVKLYEEKLVSQRIKTSQTSSYQALSESKKLPEPEKTKIPTETKEPPFSQKIPPFLSTLRDLLNSTNFLKLLTFSIISLLLIAFLSQTTFAQNILRNSAFLAQKVFEKTKEEFISKTKDFEANLVFLKKATVSLPKTLTNEVNSWLKENAKAFQYLGDSLVWQNTLNTFSDYGKFLLKTTKEQIYSWQKESLRQRILAFRESLEKEIEDLGFTSLAGFKKTLPTLEKLAIKTNTFLIDDYLYYFSQKFKDNLDFLATTLKENLTKTGYLAQVGEMRVKEGDEISGDEKEIESFQNLIMNLEPYLTINVETELLAPLKANQGIITNSLTILKNGYAGVFQFANLSSQRTYTFPNSSGTVCLDTGNCLGIGGQVLTDGGLTNRLAKFSTDQKIISSSINDLYTKGVSLFIDEQGRVGIGLNNPKERLEVLGSFAVKDKNSTSFIIGPNGNVGVGISSPTFKLQVAGQIRATDDICTEAGGGKCLSQLVQQAQSQIPVIIGSSLGGSGSGGYLALWSSTTNLTSSIISQSGNFIGIGVSSPQYTLDIGGPLRLRPQNSPPTVAKGVIYFDETQSKLKCSEDGLNFVDCISTANLSGSGAQNQIAFFTASNNLSSDINLYWDNTNKRLGIRNNNPNQTLSVAGTLGIIEGGVSPTFYTIFQGGDQSADIIYTLPTTQGAPNTVLTNDGSGNLSWSASLGGAPTNATYVVLSLDPALTAERVLTQGTNILINDGGANNNVTINTVNNPTFSTSVTSPLFRNDGNLTIDAFSTAPTNTTLTITNSGTGNLTALNLAEGDLQLGGITRISATGSGTLTNLTLTNTANQLVFTGTGGITGTLTWTPTTTNKTITLPDASGTVAVSAIAPITLSASGEIGLATPLATTYGGTGLSSIGAANQLLGVNAGATSLEYKTLQGTADQITVTHGANSITLSTPQDIATSSSPTFAGLTLTTTPLAITSGGTGATTAAGARTNLGAAASGINTDITALQGLNQQNALQLNPYGAASGNTSEIRFMELAANGLNYVGFKAPDNITSNIIWTLPSADGTANQVLTTNGAGVLSWSTPAGGAPTSASYVVLGLDPTLTAERVLTQGTNILINDGGANNNVTINTVNNPTFSTSVTSPLFRNDGNLTIDAFSTAPTNTTLTITNSGTGNLTALNLAEGDLQTSGTTRLTSSGALQNIASLSFSDSGFNGTLDVTTLTANRTYTLPDLSGEISLLGQTIESSEITDLTITNADISNTAAISLAKLASGTSGQIIVVDASGTPTYVTISGDVAISNTGVTTIQPDSVALGTDTTGNYLASLNQGSGITITGADGEGVTKTIALGPLTTDWNQTGPFNIVLNNASSQLKILESTGNTFYGTIDVGDLTGDKTYIFPDFAGTSAEICLTTGNCAGVGGGIIGSGTATQIAFFTASNTINSDNNLYWDNTNKILQLGNQGQSGKLKLYSEQGATDFTVIFQPNSSMTQNVIYTLPPDDGGTNQVLTTDGNGNLTWQSVGGIGGLSGGGTTNRIAKFTAASALGDSSINDLYSGLSITIDNSGNVGIGTTTPGILLTLRKATSGNVFAIRNTADTADTFTITDTGVINLGTWQGTAISTQYGGTGQNWSAIAQGNIPYFSATGVMATLAPGTASQVLITGGAGANPSWSNIASLLTAGTNISISGNTNATIATVPNPTFSTSVTSPTFRNDGSLIIDAVSTTNTTLTITNSGTGNLTALNLAEGDLQTSGTTRLTSSGALQNISSLSFSDSGFNGTLDVTTLTANRTYTLPDLSGEISLLGQTIESSEITDLTITNADISNTAAISLAKLASGTSGQIIVVDASGTPTYVTISGDVAISNTGVTTIQPDSVALGTDTTGNYLASLNQGSGITITGADGEGVTKTIALGPLTTDWNQTGPFNIVLNNASSQLKILESTGNTFYGTIDVGDLTGDKTYIFPDFTGTSAEICLTTGNCAGVGGGIVGSGTATQIAFFTASNTINSDNNLYWDNTNKRLGIGTTTPSALLDVSRPNTTSNSELISIRSGGFTQTISAALSNARFNQFLAPTLTAATAQTVTDAATFYLERPPIAGTNVTITNAASLLFGNTADQLVLVQRSASATAGRNLTIQAGGATGTDLAGGELRLSSGIATGSGSSFISFYTATAGASGTTDRLPTEKMRIDGAGNVGIGTTTPAYKLEVIGTGRFSSDLTVSGNLTVSGAGPHSFAGTLSPTNVSAFTLTGNITGSGSPNITGIGQFSGSTATFSTSVTSPLFRNDGNLTLDAFSTAPTNTTLTITNSGTGNLTALNLAEGDLQTSGTTRLTSSGALQNISSLSFSDSGFNGTLDVTTLTANRTYTLPDLSGEISLLGQTIESSEITDLTITNADISNTAAISLAKLASGTSGQIIVVDASGTPTYVTISGDVAISNTGVTTIQPDSVALGTDTTGNYLASLNQGSGITITGADGEGVTKTIALGPLTTDWNQTGPFNIVLNNASSQLKILESTGNTFYGTIDVGDLTGDKTYIFPDFAGTSAEICLTTGNCAGVGGGIIGSGTATQIAFFTASNTINSDNNLYWDNTNKRLGIGTTTPGTLLTLRKATSGNVFAIRNTTDTADTFTITDTGVINLGTWQGTAIGTQYGGTGQNWSTIAQGNIPYFSATGVMATLAPGTASQVLITGGTGANPSWSNIASLLTAGSGISISGTTNATITNTGVLSLNSASGALTLQGTTNQVNVNTAGSTITLSTPQDIATSSSPTFAGLTLSNLTSGSVLFAGAGGVISQDNANLFWDNTNKRFGIGTTAPSALLDVSRPNTTSNSELISIRSGGFTQTISAALSNARFNQFLAPTLTAATAQTVTDAATFYLERPPIAGTNVTITNAASLLFGNVANQLVLVQRSASGTVGRNLTIQAGGATGTDLAGGELRLSSGIATGSGSSFISFYTATAGATGTTDRIPTEKMRITGSGNVGIGTTAPSAKLHSLATTEQLRLGYDASNAVKFTVGSTNALTITPLVNNTSGFNFTNAADISILNIDTSNQRVGIGTTAPSAKLHVVGPVAGGGVTIRAGGGGDVLLGSGGSLFFDDNYSYSTGNYIRPVAANTQAFFTSGAERMRITSTGNVGIGTTAPSAKLHSLATTEQLRLGYDASNAVKFTVGSTNALTITPLVNNTSGFNFTNAAGTSILNIDTSNQRVGIGTTGPLEKLEVSGGIKLGNTTLTNAGTIRWSGTNFEGYNGTQWVPLDVQSTSGGGWTDTGTVVQLTTLTDDVCFGSNCATTGKIRLPNNQYIYARNATDSANRQLLGLNNFNQLVLGDSGITNFQLPGVSSLTLDMNYSSGNNTLYLRNSNDTYSLSVDIEGGVDIGGGVDIEGGLTVGGNVGIGTIAPSAKLHSSSSTTEQLRLGYDASNAVKFTVGSTNALTITPLVNNTSGFNFTNAAGTSILNINTLHQRVGIGTTAPSYLLHVSRTTDGDVAGFTDANGTCTINPTNTALICSSDISLKTDINSLAQQDSLNKILSLNPVSYRWKNQQDDTLRFGLVAQEVEKIIPQLVSQNSDGLKSVNYIGFTPFIISAIQEQQKQIEELKRLTAQASFGNSTVQTITDSYLENLKTKLILKDNGIVEIKKLSVDELKVEQKFELQKGGITLYDEETGLPYCVKIKSGQLTNTAGKCEENHEQNNQNQTNSNSNSNENSALNESPSQPETNAPSSEPEPNSSTDSSSNSASSS